MAKDSGPNSIGNSEDERSSFVRVSLGGHYFFTSIKQVIKHE